MSQRLRTARVQAGLTQQELADKIGVHLRTVSNYESHEYHRGRKGYVVQLWAIACDVDPKVIQTDRGQVIDRFGWLSAA